MTPRPTVLLALCALSLSPMTSDSATLGNVEDGGPGHIARTQAAVTPGPLASAQVAAEFPLGQWGRITPMGGGVRGFGMLAQYPAPGPQRIWVARRTQPDTPVVYTPSALVRVFDPQGNLAAIADFSGQSTETESRVLEVNGTGGGIWRVSFSGGHTGDLIEIRLPATDIWGVRGEMMLTVTPQTPRPAYLWVPPSSNRIFMAIETARGGNSQAIALRDSTFSTVLATPQPAEKWRNRKGELLIAEKPQGELITVDLPENFSGEIDFEGLPGLLCPTPEAALALQGGAVFASGRWTAGPLQARARDWMADHADAVETTPHLPWPDAVPESLAAPQVAVLGFGKYGGLNGINALLTAQNRNLDPHNPYFGIAQTEGVRDPELYSAATFNPFHGRFLSLYDSANLAALYTFPSELNPALNNPQILLRATLAGLFHIAALQGDDLIRDSSLRDNPYPITHTFFIYDGLAEAYNALRDSLDPQARAIWREGLIAIGDKVADHQAYMSNQWAHMLHAHLLTYIGTGEERFLRYFEHGMKAYVEGGFGPNSKFGLHPSGFFLEAYGPDGNYERLNLYSLVDSYNHYITLENRNLDLSASMHEAIERNLRFKSFFWIPQPDGNLHSPTAMNCRTDGQMHFGGYPGEYLAREHFPLGASRYYITEEPLRGIGIAATNSFMANTPEWIAQTLQQGVAWGSSGFDQPAGHWLFALAPVYASGQIAPAATLPFEEEGGRWNVPGLLAWKEGQLYGFVFYDVAGTQQKLAGRMSGGPTALWTEHTGTFIASMQPHGRLSPNPFTTPAELTFSCIYGKDASGRFFSSGTERATLSASGQQEAEQYTISSKLTDPVLASVNWQYAPEANALELSVSARTLTEVSELAVNLPLLKRIAGTEISIEAPGSLLYRLGNYGIRIRWDATAGGRLEDSALPHIQRLVINLNPDGTPLVLRIEPVSL